MSKLRHAESFRDLAVYEKARWVAKSIFEVTKTFPREEMYSLTDQLRRSSRSIGAQIAEAWAKRYERHFVSKLTDADAEQQETQHWTDTAAECGYLGFQQAGKIKDELSEIGRMLHSMIRKAGLFCGGQQRGVRESAGEYFVARTEE